MKNISTVEFFQSIKFETNCLKEIGCNFSIKLEDKCSWKRQFVKILTWKNSTFFFFITFMEKFHIFLFYYFYGKITFWKFSSCKKEFVRITTCKNYIFKNSSTPIKQTSQNGLYTKKSALKKNLLLCTIICSQ